MRFASFLRQCFASLIVVLTVSGPLSTIQAQRLSDKDVEHLMGNLNEDAKAFRRPFESSLKKSSLRRTSQEKDAKELAKQFEKQTGDMLNAFKSTKKADTAFQTVNATAQKLDAIVQQLGTESAATVPWARVQSDLKALNAAFGITASAAFNTPSSDAPCVQTVGEQRSAMLVQQCLQVSTATHPPCNAENSCNLITAEIRRGCSLIGSNAPSFCSEYQ